MTREERVGVGAADELAARKRAAGLLRELLADVERDQPAASARTVRHRSDRPGRVQEQAPDAGARRLGRGSVVAAMAVGLLSLGGVAAASTVVTSGPLHDLGSAVRAAAGSVTDALAPSPSSGRVETGRNRAGPSAAAPGVPTAGSPATRPVGPDGTLAAADAATTAREVRALLRAAAAALDAGRPEQTAAPLGQAEAVLAAQLDLPGGPALRREAAALRARLAGPAASPSTGSPAGSPASPGRGPDTAPGHGGTRAPAQQPGRPADPPDRGPAASRAPHPAPPGKGPATAPATRAPRPPAPSVAPAGRSEDPSADRPGTPSSGSRPGSAGTSGKGSGGRSGG